MCGIAGMWGNPNRDVVQGMTAQIQSRGPDGEGYYFDTHAALGHRRLKIIDLSSDSDQPFFRADKKLVLIFNGEIYNFREIRKDLEALGHKFRTTGDTEVLLASYEEYGEDCVKQFIGMFAFAILDLRNSEPSLFLARDHFGIKPIVYANIGGTTLFASEIKAIIASGLIDPEPDPVALQQLLLNGYVVQPRTFFKEIKALEPGHAMRLYPNKPPRIWRYWDLNYSESQSLSDGMDYSEQVQTVRRLLEESIRYRMISDVPLGAFLSSGIDSNAVVGLMSKQVDKPLQTFSVGFGAEAGKIDESVEAQKSAEFFGTDHTKVHFNGEDLIDILPEIAFRVDQPTSVALQYYVISQAAKQGVTVSISGLGSDEVFCGYEALFLTINDSWAKGSVQKKPLMPAIARSGIWKPIPVTTWKMKWEAIALRSSIHQQFALWHLIHTPFQAKNLVLNSGSNTINFSYFEAEDDKSIEDPINRFSRLCTKFWMVSKDLHDIDADSMAHSLEVRVPFLHKPLVEFVYGLPGSSKVGAINPGEKQRGKRILIDAVKDVIPPWTYSKRKKGFFMPFYKWLQEPLKPLVDDVFDSTYFRNSGLFDPNLVDREWQQFQKGNRRWAHIWMLAITGLYYKSMRDLVNNSRNSH